MKKISISICIPTYNRIEYLPKTLESIEIAAQKADLNDNIEICISDNASSDGTDEYIKKYIVDSKIKVTYNRNTENIGADANYLKVIEIASGEYCWFMGSDDVITSDSLIIIKEEIKSGYDIYLGNRIDCDKSLNPNLYRSWLNVNHDHIYNLSNSEEFSDYCNNALSLGALFSYLSCIIFKRQKWLNQEFDDSFLGTAYAHAFMLLSFLREGCVLKYLNSYIVYSRGGNDSFLQEGQVNYMKRVLLDIRGYTFLSKKLFHSEPSYQNSILQVIKLERPQIKTLLDLRHRLDDIHWKIVEDTFNEAGYHRTITFLIGNLKLLLLSIKILIRNSKKLINFIK